MYKTNTELLKKKISENKMTFQEVSDNLGIDRATFYRRLQNNKLRICDMQKLTDMLKMSGEEATSIFLAS